MLFSLSEACSLPLNIIGRVNKSLDAGAASGKLAYPGFLVRSLDIAGRSLVASKSWMTVGDYENALAMHGLVTKRLANLLNG